MQSVTQAYPFVCMFRDAEIYRCRFEWLKASEGARRRKGNGRTEPHRREKGSLKFPPTAARPLIFWKRVAARYNGTKVILIR